MLADITHDPQISVADHSKALFLAHVTVLLPGESRGQRSLAGYSPWGGKESDTTEAI